jgi:ribonuclease HII
LTAEKRDELLSRLHKDDSVAWAANSISAQHISSRMLAPSRTSLNELAFEATFELLEKLLAMQVNISAVCCCDKL